MAGLQLPVGLATLWILLGGVWTVLALRFLRQLRAAAQAGKSSAGSPLGRVGLLVQAAGFLILFWGIRMRTENAAQAWTTPGPIQAVLILGLAGVAVVFVLGSLRALGRHWALDARTLADHRLVTLGPYAWVRHPIYTGMGALLLATGISVGHGPSLAVSLGLYAVGTALRVTAEDRVLEQAFGPRFAAYRASVPAILPRIGGSTMADTPAHPETSAQPLSASEFLQGRRIAVAGVSRDSRQAANAVFRKLRDSGYEVFPVNPRTSQVEGVACFPDLRSIPGTIDGVVIATSPRVSLEIVRQCAAAGVKQVWFHRSFGPGSVSEEALRECRDRGIRAIPAGCPLMYCQPVDVFHRCMRGWLTWRGKVPKS